MEKTRRIPIPELLTLLNVGLYCYVLYVIPPAEDFSVFWLIIGNMFLSIWLPYAGLADVYVQADKIHYLNWSIFILAIICLLLLFFNRRRMQKKMFVAGCVINVFFLIFNEIVGTFLFDCLIAVLP